MQIQKSVNNARLLLKAGRFPASDDMNASPIYGLYLNNGFDGDIRNVLFDTQFSAYPFSTWAGYARYKVSEKVQLQSAVYQTWSDIFSSKHHGLDWGIHDNDGIITMHQLAWSPTLKKGDPVRGEGLPGHYWLGSTYSPWKGYTPFLSSTQVGNS
jgi:porin